jgi:TonB family protein
MLELKPRPTVATSRINRSAESKQPRRLLLALVLLLVALGAVVVMDREFWFGPEQSIIDDMPQPARQVAQPTAKTPSVVTQKPVAPVHGAKKQVAAVTNSALPQASDSPVVSRTVLPPLDVDVVAGNAHRKIRPGSNASNVEIANSGSAAPAQASTFAVATSAADRERIDDAAQPQASYPLLAQHMNVQGSVVLQALIGADGIIQNLQVLSGPGILATAAQQAVREWRFKPIVQNGQAVETKAKITVNFTIKVADSAVKTTLAESRASDRILILSR